MDSRNELLQDLVNSNESLTVDHEGLSQPRLATTTLTNTEVMTFEGKRFYGEIDFTLASGATKYIMYQMPNVASSKIIALQSRQFKSLNGGAEIEILWDSTGVVLGASVPTFNENRNIAVVATMLINEVTSVAVDGTIRESDFLQGTGSGSNSSGAISADLGLRLYSPDSFFIAKVTNLESQNNRIHLSYTWIEIDTPT